MLGEGFQGNCGLPRFPRRAHPHGFLLVLLDCFGVSNVLRQTRILIAHLLLGSLLNFFK